MVFRNTFFDTRYSVLVARFSVLGSRISVLIITIMLYGHLTPCPTFIEYHFELYYTIVYLVSHIPHPASHFLITQSNAPLPYLIHLCKDNDL